MLEEIHQVHPNQVRSVSWQGDPLYYDLELYQLGEGHEEFWVLNPIYENTDLRFFIEDVPYTRKCLVFTHNGDWVVKLFKEGWYPYHGYETVEIDVPRLVWSRNPDIDSRMAFDQDPRLDYTLEFWDRDYEMYWTMDPRFFPHEGEVWVYKAQVIGRKTQGRKHMGTVSPMVNVNLNTELDFLKLNTDDLLPAYYDLDNECIFILDQAYTGKEKIEVASVTPAYKKPVGRRVVGVVSPELSVSVNPKLKHLTFDLADISIRYEDLKKENVWMLDSDFLGPDDKNMWAIKIKPPSRSNGRVVSGTIAPYLEITANPELPELDFRIDAKIPWYDLKYEHMWMLDSKHTVDAPESIWAVKVNAVDNPLGTKLMGSTEPFGYLEVNKNITVPFSLPEDFAVQYYDFDYEYLWTLKESGKDVWVARLSYVDEPAGIKKINLALESESPDVIFISYGEPNAEENWQRVLSKAPNAKRIDGVKGILNAHKRAARLATTDMFYVVDGDAYLTDDWAFDFIPSVYDRDCSFVWRSKNSVNDLIYGYGGVKLLSKELVLKVQSVEAGDLFMSISPKLKVMNAVSNHTNFNTSEYSAWRSAFRECAKLYIKDDQESVDRLSKWLSPDNAVEFSKWVKLGAEQGQQYAEADPSLSKINDYNWLKKQFDKIC